MHWDSPLHRHPDHPRLHQGCHRDQGPPGPGGPRRRLPSPHLCLPHEGRRRPRDLPHGGARLEVHVRALSPGATTRPVAANLPGDHATASPPPPRAKTASEPFVRGLGASLGCRGRSAEPNSGEDAGTLAAQEIAATPAPSQSHEQPARASEREGVEGDRWYGPAVSGGAMNRDGTEGERATEGSECPPAEGDRSIAEQTAARRRITGKRRPAVVLAKGAAVGTAGCINSTPEGDRVHDGGAATEGGETCVSVGTRLCDGGGVKRARLEEGRSATRRIGSVDLSPARARGEMNTFKKSTYDCLSGSRAAGEAVHVAGAEAAAAFPSTQCTRPEG